MRIANFIREAKWPVSLVLVILKLAGTLDASWLVVLAPLWVCFALGWTAHAVSALLGGER
jgi:hypothetical protein